ncbi:hypothetical protein TTHERM_01215040 (macronuclear) [Tetrahymena thermophila SB210]|uniref:Uncharacterized protein n=1 Tax=Tetrahymena thermophila (strain SB210) TaxID=312017 RepID=Q22VB0_TETTS|nr:hypothetical protein TTHERM_01215040 [Tetrahymena thermophila SB210]EAR89209.4 hypothetical protein TTHERM_01215040 [Tetrahymena thermophila SB210]|eukprot:XP_001009454.4 hypothetical protein TTHERM_01215040 [Tetrahymena thermophila SB210]
MECQFSQICDEHPNLTVNYVYQQEMDQLKLGCFSCATQEKGTFFYNLKHFIHQAEEIVNERLGMFKKGNHVYYEVTQLLNDLKDQQKANSQYGILQQIIQFFEINEENYKLQFTQTNNIEKYSNESQQFSSDQSDYEDSFQMSIQSGKKDFEYETEQSESEMVHPHRNFIEFSLYQSVKKLKGQALASALDRCQDIKSHNYLPSMNWKQFQSHSQYYVNLEYNYYYHIYCENDNDFENDKQNIIQEYEQKYQPIRADQLQSIQSNSLLTSPSLKSPVTENKFSNSSNQTSRKNSIQTNNSEKIHKDKQIEEGRFFHECVECSLIYQQTQEQIQLLNIMFQDIKQIIVYQKLISPIMTFCPIQIFWDLRINI